MWESRNDRILLTLAGGIVVALLCLVAIFWFRATSGPATAVPPETVNEIESYLSNYGNRELDGPLTFTPAHAADDDGHSLALEVFWLTQDNPKLPLNIQLRLASEEGDQRREEAIGAELREREVVFSQLPRGLYTFADPKGRVIFPPHAVRSDGDGRVVLGVSNGAESGIPCASAARVQIDTRSADATANAPASVHVEWIADPGRRDLHSWGGEMIVPLAEGAGVSLVLPRLETTFIVAPDAGYAFEWEANGIRRTGFGYSHGIPRDGEVIELHLIRCGFLIARVRELNAGDFIHELEKQFDGRSVDPQYPLHAEIRTGTGLIEAATPGSGFELACDRARAERIGNGSEAIRIPFVPTAEAREVHVTVSGFQVVASAHVTVLPGIYEMPVWLDAVNVAWEVQVIAEDSSGDRVEGVSITLQPSVWIKKGTGALFIGPDRERTTSENGVARFEGLPFMPGVFMTLRVESSYSVVEAPQIIEAPAELKTTVVRIRLDESGAKDRLWVRVDIPEGTPGAANWLEDQFRYAIVGTDDGGQRRTWDDAVSLRGKNTFAIADVPPGEYLVLIKGSFGVATSRGRITASERTLTITLAPRAFNGVLLRDGKPLANAVVFPLPLEPTLVRTLGESGAHGMISLGQRTTDSQGKFSILHSGETPPEEWGYFHKDTGAFRVTPGEVASDGRQVLNFESAVPSGKLVLSFTPSDDGTLASSVHLTPIISEDEKRTVLDFAWGIALPVTDSELVIDKLPAGRYMVLVTGKTGGGGDQITVAPEWKQIAVIEEGRTTSITFPYTD